MDQTLTVTDPGKEDQTITFAALEEKTYGDPALELTATSSSGLPISYSSSDELVVVIEGSTLTIAGAGTAVITATQAGSDDYTAAANVEQNITINKASQTISFSELESKTFGDADFQLTATASSGLEVNFTSDNENVVLITGTLASLINQGETTITASQSGNGNYLAAESVSHILLVSSPAIEKQDQTITFAPLIATTYGANSFDLAATTSSGLPITYTSSNTSVATISGLTLTPAGIGETSITASQSGNSEFNPAVEVVQPLLVEKALLTVAADNKQRVYGDANPSLTITYTGFVNNDTDDAITTTPTISTTATTSSDAGAYPITLEGGMAGNYELNLVAGSLTIGKRLITVTADDKTMNEGGQVPVLTANYDGFVNGDNEDLIDVAPIISTTATSFSSVGEYPVTLAGGEDNNYDFFLVDGILTINLALAIDRDLTGEINIYPNPSQDKFQVSSLLNQQVKVYNLDGKLVKLSSSNKVIEINELPAGTYLIKVGEKQQVYRLIKK